MQLDILNGKRSAFAFLSRGGGVVLNVVVVEGDDEVGGGLGPAVADRMSARVAYFQGNLAQSTC